MAKVSIPWDDGSGDNFYIDYKILYILIAVFSSIFNLDLT